MKSFLSKTVVVLVLLLVAVLCYVLFFPRPSLFSKEISNVLLISIDTCRADFLGCYGYNRNTTPNIDELAKTGILFENVISPVPLTLPAHTSMMTGTVPPYHGIHDNPDYKVAQSNVTLAEILRDNGFATGAVISSIIMDSQFGLNQGFDSYSDRFENSFQTIGLNERRAEEVSEFGLQWLEQHQKEKFFLFLHYYDPHYDYVPPEPFATRFVENPYAGEIAYTDYCIGKVINKLKESGLYDSTMIIVTADHGEMLEEHGESSHGFFIYQSAIKVPLVIKPAGKSKPQRINHIVGLIDIVPTVCSMLGIKAPADIQGRNLSEHLFGNKSWYKERDMYCESLYPTKYNANSLLGIANGRWKYIQTTEPELYNLINDPRESNNLIEQKPQLARILQDRLKQILEQTIREKSAESKLVLDERVAKSLESLGYLSGCSIDEDYEFNQT